jgi:hypothetical protein
VLELIAAGETRRRQQPGILSADFSFGKTKDMLVFLQGFYRSRLGVPGAAAATLLEGEKFGSDTSGLDLLQALEIPQNHQDILWKSLALEPHFFGKAWHYDPKKFGGVEGRR